MEIKIDEIVKQVLAEIGTAAGQEKNIAPTVPEKETVPEKGRTAVPAGAEEYEIREFAIPQIKEKEILVRMEGCMISGTDAAEFLKERRIPGSRAFGQDGTGVIVKLGSAGQKDARGKALHVGDRVIAVKRVGYPGTRPGAQEPVGNHWFSSYTVLPAGGVFQVNELDLESRLLVRMAAEVNGAVSRARKLGRVDSSGVAVIIGCTMEGLMAAAALKCAGIDKVIMLGNETQKEYAAAFGAGAFVSSHGSRSISQARDEVLKYAGSPADLVLLCTSSPVGKNMAKRLMKSGGTICDLTYISGRGKRSLESFEESLPAGGRFFSEKEYESALEMLYKAGENGIPMYKLITHRYKLGEINEAHWAFIREEGFGIALFNR